MDTNVKLNAAEELNMGELDAVSAGAFSTMDVDSKMFPIAAMMLPFGGLYAPAAMAYAALK
jgi:hypothetical protein